MLSAWHSLSWVYSNSRIFDNSPIQLKHFFWYCHNDEQYCEGKCLLPLNLIFKKIQIQSEIFVLHSGKMFFYLPAPLPLQPAPGTWQALDPSLFPLSPHLCGMMQMMTNSFIPHHACAANLRNTQGWADLGTWLRARLTDWLNPRGLAPSPGL